MKPVTPAQNAALSNMDSTSSVKLKSKKEMNIFGEINKLGCRGPRVDIWDRGLRDQAFGQFMFSIIST